MQKDFTQQNRGQTRFSQQNQIIYSPQPTLAPLQPQMMQAHVRPQMYQQNIVGGQSQPIRHMINAPRMYASAQPFIPGVPSVYSQGQPNDVQGYSQQQGYMPQYIQNGGQPQYQYQMQSYQPRNTFQHVYQIVPPGYTTSNVVLPQQPQIRTSQDQHMQSQRVFNTMNQTPAQPQQTQMQHVMQSPQMPPQQQPAAQKKRTAIKLTDPNTGKDLTSELLKIKTERSSTAPTAPGYPSTTNTPPPDDVKAKVSAMFAAQVYAVAQSNENTSTNKTEVNPSSKTATETDPANKIETSKVEIKKPTEVTVNDNVNTEMTPAEDSTVILSEVNAEIIKNNVEKKTDTADLETKSVISQESTVEIIEQKHTEKDFEPAEISKPEESTKKVENIAVEDIVVAEVDSSVELTPEVPVEEGETTVTEDKSSEPISSSQDDSAKANSAFSTVIKKKKGKHRFKDIDSKESSSNTDMLSAFVDKPAVVEVPVPVKETKVPEKAAEDKTWEEKEKTIEKEEIRNEDAEEPEVVPKKIENIIIKSEDIPTTVEDDEKLQYDRDFLLKFQFAPICTSKPAGLPKIDIVLDQAHAPTKALVPGQRITASNDFMPTFMRQASGGRSSGGRSSKDRRGGPATGGGRFAKVLQAPLFQKVELKKSENAWVRPSEKLKDMSEKQQMLDEVERNVRSILNKLTPQKFKTLVDQMLQLKIDSQEKLEISIDLIFEKAIGEPGFSVAYANMCRVLTDNYKAPVSNLKDKTNTSTITFRKILLNKCQKEFEKESSDEKLLEEDRNKTFEKEEEKKAWKEELDMREMMNRRRMLGNIRFIGELFKLKMISENIMHDCLFKLLRSEKQESLEDQLECLCKLLATIGKDLDHKKAKPRMDQYFTHINKIIEKKKISSRIKFALKDVTDLRSNNWVPRRDEGNPKTIDQIHKEAQAKEKVHEMARQQDKLQRKLEPRGGRGGGRDSPVVRGGPSQNVDGWINVSSKTSRATPVDASRFKNITKKTVESEISLGPGGRPGAWSRGASGGGSRPGSGSNTPTSEVERPTNRYEVLTDSSLAPSSFDGKSRSRQGTHARRGTPTGGTKRSSDDKSAALRAVKDMVGGSGRNSRNQSPARSTPLEDDISISGPSSGAQTPDDATLSSSVTEEKMRKVSKSTVDEYISCKDLKEAILCLKELGSPELHYAFIDEAIVTATGKKAEDRQIIGALFHDMMKDGLITLSQMSQGFTSVVELAQDLAVDIPHIYKYLGEVLGPIVYDGTFPLNKVKDTLEPLVQRNKAGHVMAEALSVAVQIAGKEDIVFDLWCQSSITWDMLLNNNENVDQFIKDKKMEFTLTSPSQQHATNLSHASQIQEEMVKLLKENSDNNNAIFTLVEKHVQPEKQSDPGFIRELTNTVCHSTITLDESNTCTCNKELLTNRKKILLRFINGNKDLELHAVYALQQLASQLDHPRDMLRTLFGELYDGDVITEETFYIWESSKAFPDGKGVALSSVKDFLSWLRKAEEESNEEDSSTPQTNVV